MNPVMAGDLGIGRGYPPRIMGVLNVSLESPYDPSVFADADEGARHVEESLVAEGADIVDIGLATANKRFDVLAADEELERLETALDIVDSVESDPVFSIETRYADVADAALSEGFDMVNDVCGFADPDMTAVCDRHGVPAVKMAGPGDFDRPGAIESVDEIYDALATGPVAEQTIIDPAFGGWSEDKTLDDDRDTFRRLREFQAIGRPMLVSINRKNFLRELAHRSTEEALPVSLAATAMAVDRGADVIRTHDVAQTKDAAIVGNRLTDNRLDDPDLGVRELNVTNQRELARHLNQLGTGKAAAADGVSHAFALSDLDPVDRSLLQSIAEEVGARLMIGRDRETAVLLVRPREVGTLRQRLGDESAALAAVLETIHEAIS